MEMRESLVVRFEGSAGDGVLSMGTIVAKAAARCGYHVCTLSSFLAEVRGGQSSFQLKLGCREVSSPGNSPDIIVALNALAVANQVGSLAPGGVLIHPADASNVPPNVGALSVDFDSVAMTESGSLRNRNLVAAGVLMHLLGINESIASAVLRDSFAKKKKSDIIHSAEQALHAGYVVFGSYPSEFDGIRLKPATGPSRLLISGNEAVALGAIVGGVRFFAGYPITPASEVMEVLAKHLPEVGGRSVQAEDEMASLGMCIGAAFGGTKALTATSGPGLSLMVELLGLAAMAELPVVVVDVQRPGPSTGMPTKDGQGDLNLAVYGAHGDSFRAVLAPQSVNDCFRDTIAAVNLASEFHIPVLVLSSQSLSHRMQTVELPALDDIFVYEEQFFAGPTEGAPPYHRYQPTEDGRASVRSVPGTEGGMYRTGGLEHDESGQPKFDGPQRTANMKRREERATAVAKHLAASPLAARAVTGNQSFAVVSWGSTAGAVREAVETLALSGHKVGSLLPRALWPLPTLALGELIASGIDTLLVCEANSSQQFANIIRAHCETELRTHGVTVVGITRDDGTPFNASDIEARLREFTGSQVDTILQAV